MDLKPALMLGSLLFASVALAGPRTVNIPADGGTLKLTNPSASSVTFAVSCKNKTGSTVLNLASEVLAAGNSKTYGTPAGSACKSTIPNLSANTANLINGAAVCHSMSTSVQVTQASTWCETGFHVCSLTEIPLVRPSLNGVWGTIATPSTFYFRSFDGMNYTWGASGNGTHYANLDSMGNVEAKCSTGANGSGTSIDACWANPVIDPMTNSTANTWSVVCCPDVVGITHCSVTIDGNTPATGHLMSPQFKGGAAF